jgi:hypothetical protein
MEESYHQPEAFRYSTNSFIRAFKEVPVLLLMTTQHRPDIREEIAPSMEALVSSDLYKKLAKKRDFLVHQGMLSLQSHGSAGTTEGRGVKISFPFRVHPWESSDEAYVRYKEICRTDKMIRSLLGPDCDSAPAIWRTWLIKEFPDRDLLDVAFEAWTKLGEVLSATVQAQGGEALDLSMPCRHDPELVRIKRFSQYEFFLEVDGVDLEEEARLWQEERARRAASADKST